MVIVHTMQVINDLNKTVLREKVVAQKHEHSYSFPLFAEPLQDINQPSDRWEGQLIINTLQGRYQARLKPPGKIKASIKTPPTARRNHLQAHIYKDWTPKGVG